MEKKSSARKTKKKPGVKKQEETAVHGQKPARTEKLSAPKKDRKSPREMSALRTGKRSPAKKKVADEAM